MEGAGPGTAITGGNSPPHRRASGSGLAVTGAQPGGRGWGWHSRAPPCPRGKQTEAQISEWRQAAAPSAWGHGRCRPPGRGTGSIPSHLRPSAHSAWLALENTPTLCLQVREPRGEALTAECTVNRQSCGCASLEKAARFPTALLTPTQLSEL